MSSHPLGLIACFLLCMFVLPCTFFIRMSDTQTTATVAKTTVDGHQNDSKTPGLQAVCRQTLFKGFRVQPIRDHISVFPVGRMTSSSLPIKSIFTGPTVSQQQGDTVFSAVRWPVTSRVKQGTAGASKPQPWPSPWPTCGPPAPLLIHSVACCLCCWFDVGWKVSTRRVTAGFKAYKKKRSPASLAFLYR